MGLEVQREENKDRGWEGAAWRAAQERSREDCLQEK